MQLINKTKVRGWLLKDRTILNGTIGEYSVVGLAYLAITVILTGFVFFHLDTQIFSIPGDATNGFAWLNFVDHSLNPFVGHTDMTNYPFGEDIGGLTMITYFATWIPMRLLSYCFGSIAALNIIMISGYVSSALCMYWLVKRLTGRKAIAFFAGYAVAFVPYAMNKSSGHLSYIFSGIFSLTIGAFIELWKKPNTKKALVLALCFAIAFYTDGYFILMGIILAVGLTLSSLIYGLFQRDGAGIWKERLRYVMLAAASFVLFVSPIILIQVTQGEQIAAQLSESRPDIGREINAYRSNIMDFIIPPAKHFLWSGNDSFKSIIEYKNLRSSDTENTNYMGITLYILCGIGMALIFCRIFLKKWSSRRALGNRDWRTVKFVACIVAVTAPLIISFMFSPDVTIHGVTIKLPASYFITNDIAIWRVMSRLFVVLNVLVVLFAAVSLWIIVKTIESGVKSAKVSRAIKLAAPILCLLLMVFEYTCVFPERPYDFTTRTPKTYSWLKSDTSIKTVAEVPFVDPLNKRSVTYFTDQIVSGKRLVNTKEADYTRLNNILGDMNNPELVNYLRERGTDIVIIRDSSQACHQQPWGALAFADNELFYTGKGSEKATVALCAYRLSTEGCVDPVYIRYGQGFAAPSAQDQPRVVFKDGYSGVISFVNDSLKSEYDGAVTLTANIQTTGSYKDVGWKILQNNSVVSSGILAGEATNINVTLPNGSPITIQIQSSSGVSVSGDVYLSNVIASATK